MDVFLLLCHGEISMRKTASLAILSALPCIPAGARAALIAFVRAL
jgi:hypothetical protein